MRYAALALTFALLAGCGVQPGAIVSGQEPETVSADAKKPTGDVAKARKWVLANSGGSFWDRPRKKLFPAVDDGNIGTSGIAFGGADGEWIADFADTWFRGTLSKPPTSAFDPDRHLMVIVETSDDEPVLLVALYDKAEATGKLLESIEIVNLSYSLNQQQFSKFFPKLGKVNDADYGQVLEDIHKRGVDLKL